MKAIRTFIVEALVSGALVALPIYLAFLLLLKALTSLTALVRPLAVLAPSAVGTEAAQYTLSLLIVVLLCFALGIAVRTKPGRIARDWFERSLLAKVPGYAIVQGLTQQLAGQGKDAAWQPALVEMAGGLMAAFIIEELPDGRRTVFVPSVPSPFRGSVYVMARERVHLLNASFAQTFQALTRWGDGMGQLVRTLDADKAA